MPGNYGSYGSSSNNQINGSDNGENQISPKAEADSSKYSSEGEVESEKDLSGSFDK